jgi:hypothetical protein
MIATTSRVVQTIADTNLAVAVSFTCSVAIPFCNCCVKRKTVRIRSGVKYWEI